MVRWLHQGLDAEDPGASTPLGQQCGRCRCHATWIHCVQRVYGGGEVGWKKPQDAPGTFDKRHVQDNIFRDIVRHLLTPEFDCAMRRVLEKKIYRIFCFLDEDMDSPGLKTSQSGTPPIHDFKLLRVRCLDTFARFCKCFTVSAGSCKINIDQPVDDWYMLDHPCFLRCESSIP